MDGALTDYSFFQAAIPNPSTGMNISRDLWRKVRARNKDLDTSQMLWLFLLACRSSLYPMVNTHTNRQ
ncbi:uncharacterized protein ALTATR162_LOCUS1348 [Alternaria atra]|uniref:Uncharacterized protein n=1 Tax=Alternaria atra TaxID=119953 RepID=A0A8J2HTY1_9PLEO|nr:uncharacterized protein ALTATR162_LOCUS1348 [Alternaria atra]CAG5143429.1 unnamed protein product [Alternaria atra]